MRCRLVPCASGDATREGCFGDSQSTAWLTNRTGAGEAVSGAPVARGEAKEVRVLNERRSLWLGSAASLGSRLRANRLGSC